MTKTQRNFYKKIAEDLRYDYQYIERIKKAKSVEECRRILEYARIHSIDRDMLHRGIYD